MRARLRPGQLQLAVFFLQPFDGIEIVVWRVSLPQCDYGAFTVIAQRILHIGKDMQLGVQQ